jgi:hypothetical protein
MGEYKADDRFGWLGNGLPFNIKFNDLHKLIGEPPFGVPC